MSLMCHLGVLQLSGGAARRPTGATLFCFRLHFLLRELKLLGSPSATRIMFHLDDGIFSGSAETLYSNHREPIIDRSASGRQLALPSQVSHVVALFSDRSGVVPKNR